MQKMMEQRIKHGSSPTLDTILMVEKTLQNADSIITVAELKRALPRKVNHNTLITVLEYLEKSNKIAVTLRGITWIYSTNPKVRKLVAHGREL